MNRLPKGVALIGLLAAAAWAPTVSATPGEAAEAPAGASPAGRLVVHFHHAVPPGLEAGSALHGAAVLAVDRVLGFAVVAAPDRVAFTHEARLRPEIRAVEPDGMARLASYTPNDPEYSVSVYGPQLIGAPAAWDTTLGSPSVRLCILDTGIRASHVEFSGRVLAGTDLVNGDSDPRDDNGHGTHVAGIAAAATGNGAGISGIAQAGLLVAKVLDASGAGYMSTVASGIRWCADQGARIVSMSLGATAPSTAVQDAVAYAWGKGALLAAAAGNGGCVGCVQYPAAYAQVIAVGCVDIARAVCSFTSQGPEVDLAAPGMSIQSTWHTSDTALMRAAGTSMSAPHVAGAAALVWSAHPGYTNAQVRQALESSAQDVGAAGRDAASGSGLVRVDLAMVANVTAATPPPAPEPPAEPAPPAVTHGASLTPAHQAKQVAPKGTATYAFTLQNTGSGNDTFTVAKAQSRSGWTTALAATSYTLAPGEAVTLVLSVTAPTKGPSMTVTLTVSAAGSPLASASAQTSILR